MDSAQIAILAIVIVQLLAYAFTYGKLTQKVSDIDKRVARLEKASNSCTGSG